MDFGLQDQITIFHNEPGLAPIPTNVLGIITEGAEEYITTESDEILIVDR